MGEETTGLTGNHEAAEVDGHGTRIGDHAGAANIRQVDDAAGLGQAPGQRCFTMHTLRGEPTYSPKSGARLKPACSYSAMASG